MITGAFEFFAFALFFSSSGLLFRRDGIDARPFSRLHFHGREDVRLGLGHADAACGNDGIDANQFTASTSRRHLHVLFQKQR